MSVAASSLPPAERPRADPQELRRFLPPALLSQFDEEWELVLERAKHAKELAPIQELLAKWQQIAAAEAGSPGIYERVQAKAAEIERTGRNTTAGSMEDMRGLINRRLARSSLAVYRVVPDEPTREQVAALPVEALEAYAELLSFLDDEVQSLRGLLARCRTALA